MCVPSGLPGGQRKTPMRIHSSAFHRSFSVRPHSRPMLKIAAHRADPAVTAAPRVPRWPFGLAAAAVVLTALYLSLPGAGSALPAAGRSTLVVFAGATLFWLF